MPEREQRLGYLLGLDPVGRVEVVAFGEGFEGEVRERRSESLRHWAEVVGIAAATECEIDGAVERPQRLGGEIAILEGGEKSSDTCGPLGHPRWGWAFGRRRWLDAGGEL